MLQKINKLIENKQYQTLREEISEMNAADLAALFEELSGEEIVKIFGFFQNLWLPKFFLIFQSKTNRLSLNV